VVCAHPAQDRPATAADAAGGRTLGLSGSFDLVLLDMVLGADDGFTLLAELRRSRSTMPVLGVTGNPTHRDVVACLENGADDYLVKPFRLEELLARVRARLRAPVDSRTVSTLTSGDIIMDLLTRRVLVAGREVELISRKFALLEVLVRHAGQVLSREQLLSQVWGTPSIRGATSSACSSARCGTRSATTPSRRCAGRATASVRPARPARAGCRAPEREARGHAGIRSISARDGAGITATWSGTSTSGASQRRGH
jgi:DNA-binding response OmpR family regulator